MKLIEFYIKVFERYKLVIYIFVSVVIYTNPVIFFALFVCLSVYELFCLVCVLYAKKSELKSNSTSEKNKGREVEVMILKEKLKQDKFSFKKRGK